MLSVYSINSKSVVTTETEKTKLGREKKREIKRFLDADNMIITSFDNLVISRNRKIIFLHDFSFSFARDFSALNMKMVVERNESVSKFISI